MPVFEVIGGGDRRSLIKRFERKSKHDAVSELVDFHLLHCSRIETLEAEAQALREEVERGNRITCAMALDIAAVGEALGIPGEQQEGGTGEFIDIIDEMKAAQAAATTPAWNDVQTERRRQIEAEGWTQDHDDKHGGGQMARAAACYALAGSCAPSDQTAAMLVSLAWPWTPEWWKPTTSRRDLVKAAALILAEIERLDRATAPTQGIQHE